MTGSPSLEGRRTAHPEGEGGEWQGEECNRLETWSPHLNWGHVEPWVTPGGGSPLTQPRRAGRLPVCIACVWRWSLWDPELPRTPKLPFLLLSSLCNDFAAWGQGILSPLCWPLIARTFSMLHQESHVAKSCEAQDIRPVPPRPPVGKSQARSYYKRRTGCLARCWMCRNQGEGDASWSSIPAG